MEATTIPTTSSNLDTVTLAKKGDREAFISLMERLSFDAASDDGQGAHRGCKLQAILRLLEHSF